MPCYGAEKRIHMTNNHGGARIGAGRKYKYGCKTVLVRIPIAILEQVTEMMQRLEQAHAKKKNEFEPV